MTKGVGGNGGGALHEARREMCFRFLIFFIWLFCFATGGGEFVGGKRKFVARKFDKKD